MIKEMIYRILGINENIPKRIRKNKTISCMCGAHVDINSEIGDYSYIGYNSFVSRAKIGRYCSIANNVAIGMGEHNLGKVSTSSIFYENPYEELTAKDCIIEDDVWIGVNAVIFRGVRVGRGAVVGAGAIVKKDVPPYAIVVGVPAKILKYRFDNERILAIEDTKWWEKKIEEAKECIERL